MKREDIKSDVIAKVNSNCDFMMCGDTKHLIGNFVTIVKLTKAGMVQVRYDNKLYSIPPKNISEVPALTKNDYDKLQMSSWVIENNLIVVPNMYDNNTEEYLVYKGSAPGYQYSNILYGTGRTRYEAVVNAYENREK